MGCNSLIHFFCLSGPRSYINHATKQIHFFCYEMPTSCSFATCCNKDTLDFRNRGITFICVPKLGSIRNKWIEAIRSTGKKLNPGPNTKISVCSEHFQKEDFQNDPYLTYKKLKTGIVPSIFTKKSESPQKNEEFKL